MVLPFLSPFGFHWPAAWSDCVAVPTLGTCHSQCTLCACALEMVWRPARKMLYANYALINASGVQIKQSKAAVC